jgi:hypothetical protein
MRNQKRARDFAKIHHEDPSGFWKLVATGKELPEVGQQILYVVDIRGHKDELMHNLLAKIADGDPYHVINKAVKDGRMRHDKFATMMASVFELPVDPAKANSHVGIVDHVEYDATLQEWYIGVRHRITECIIYWSPIPRPPNTYTPRDEDVEDLHMFESARSREVYIRDRLESRRLRRLPCTD